MRIMAEIPGAKTEDGEMDVAARTDDAIVARLVSNMVHGEAPAPDDEPFASDIAITYIIQCPDRGRARLARRAEIPSDEGKRRRLMDVVMARAFSAEPLAVSVARVAKAVAVIGFDVCTAFTATCAYNIFPELETEEFKGNGKRRGKGSAARSA